MPVRPARLLAVGLVGLLAVVLTGCDPPPYRFMASDADDVAAKIPRAWKMVRSGVPRKDDGTPADPGNWFAVYDAAAKPSITHVDAPHTTAPVALVRTIVITKEQASGVTDDILRDLVLPVTDATRASAKLQGFDGTGFQLLSDTPVRTRTSSGVHVVFSYDLGEGPEVFDQVVLTDKHRTRAHLLVVHCSRACYESNRKAITTTADSFTVRS